jgi:aminocarboxymuconate-semialdehyde decarboxylase
VTIDTHAHFWPSGLLAAAHNKQEWYGWDPVQFASGNLGLALGNRLVRFPVPSVDLEDEAQRAEHRKLRNVDAEVMMPVGFLWNHHLDGSQAAGYCRSINEELADVQQRLPHVYRGAGMLPFQAPSEFGAELAALVNLGLGAVALPASVRSVNLDDHVILSMVEQVIDAGLAMLLHPTYLDPPGAERFPRYYFTNSIGASLECTVGLMSLIHAGLFDRRADIKLAVVQGGGSVPYEIGRFSLRYRERSDVRTMREPPEAYLSRVFYDCMVADSDSLHLLVDRVGSDRVMIGTDHPFRSDVPSGAAKWISADTTLTEAEKTAILHGNAAAVFGFES